MVVNKKDLAAGLENETDIEEMKDQDLMIDLLVKRGVAILKEWKMTEADQRITILEAIEEKMTIQKMITEQEIVTENTTKVGMTDQLIITLRENQMTTTIKAITLNLEQEMTGTEGHMKINVPTRIKGK
jgi:hypothetical protein